jgi:hypothetical protein
MQLANCSSAMVTPKAKLRRYKLSPGCTVYRTQSDGGPQRLDDSVGGMPGTYRIVPEINSSVTRQFAWIKASLVTLYISARSSSVSPAWILIGDHPDGDTQLDVGVGRAGVGDMGVSVSVSEGVKSGTVLVFSPGSFVAALTVGVMVINRGPRVRVATLCIASFRPFSVSDKDKLPRITAAESRVARMPSIAWRKVFTPDLHELCRCQAASAHYKLHHGRDPNPPICGHHELLPAF